MALSDIPACAVWTTLKPEIEFPGRICPKLSSHHVLMDRTVPRSLCLRNKITKLEGEEEKERGRGERKERGGRGGEKRRREKESPSCF